MAKSSNDGGNVDALSVDSHANRGGYMLVLAEESVSISRRSQEIGRVLLEDVLGVETAHSKGTRVDLMVHGFPKTRKLFRGETRWRAKILHCFDSEDANENERLAKEWKKKIVMESRKVIQKKYNWYYEGKELTAEPRKYLVFINPAGGKGKAVHIYHSQIRPLFELAGAECQVIVTEHPGHAQSVVKTYDLSKIDAVIMVSGDGLLYEVINGIMERPDWATAINTPIGILPTGSGNALCASLLYEAGEEFSIANAVFQVLCGAISPMDILTAHTTEGKKYFSLLANWGMIADIDIESEKYRRLGETRFLIGAVSCIIKKKIYHGKVSYLPKDTNTDGLESMPSGSAVTQTAEQQNHCNESTNEPLPMEQSGGATEDASHSMGQLQPAKSDSSSNGPPTPLINHLSDPVPSNWVVIEGDFININFTTVSHMAHDVFAANRASVGCGTIYLVYPESSLTSRLDLVKMIDKMAKGNHTEMRMMHVVEAKAFRIEPTDGPGLMTLDGEEVPYGPLQAQIHPQLGRVLGRRTKPQQ